MGKITQGCEPCGCKDWKLMLRELWERYQTTVRVILMGGREYRPDGDGRVVLPMPEPVNGVVLYDMTDHWSLFTANDDIVALTNKGTYWTMEVTHS